MKHFPLMLLSFCSIYVHLFFLFTLISLCFMPDMTAFTSGNEIDHLALLKFKESISTDPDGIFLSWNISTHFCNWHGITCDPILQRVTELNLQRYKLKGLISSHVGNLSFLRNFNLGDNSFYGKIPQELGRLSQLQYLSVKNNLLTGKIPTNLTGCTNLKILYLYRNNLIGKIPMQISSLSKLQHFAIHINNLIGGVPSSIGNLSSLTILDVSRNNFEGSIPQEICNLQNMTFVSLGENQLTGTFPSCFYNMSSLTMISATENNLNGSLPPNMFDTLPNLQELYIGENQISGSIPPSITNASIYFLALESSRNKLMGQIPSLGKLQYLDILSLSWNNLGDNSTNDFDFLKSLANCSRLKVLSISYNNFGGHLPNSLGNLSTQLSQLYLGGNHISGKIPATIGNLVGLTLLTIEENGIGGKIPTTFGKFYKMNKLNLGANKLSGEIKAYIGNLSELFHLELEENALEGNIPTSIGNCQKLQYLDLSHNNLTGIIPSEVFMLSSLTILNLSQNSLSSNISEEVGNLKNINLLDMSENHLSGKIPGTIGECILLGYLYLQGNYLQGIIPSSLASLRGLQHLDLSQNDLSGSIPNVLQKLLFLQYFNVSFNKLVGEVPSEGIFRNTSGLVLTGNSKLCGGISDLHLPPCLVKGKTLAKHHKLRLIAVIISVVVFLLILSIILIGYWLRKKSKNISSSDSPTTDHQLALVSYQTLHNSTNGFSSTNLIGSGNFSFVYKGTLEFENKIVAIKVLNLQKRGAEKSFITECNALRNIKHKNLVHILTCCSSVDYKGKEFKALIFEYMRNGSLEQWLHPMTLSAEHPRTFSLDQRLNVMIDIASALRYLHHECEQSIIHCDLKPSNVLLDEDMIAHVSDFGIARLLSTIDGTTSKQTSTNGIRGTVGYVPPEYGMGFEVTTHGDVYSFGILMLEMLTGRRPTDEMIEDNQKLHNFVETSFPNNVLQILDPQLIPTNEATILKGNDWDFNPNVEKCLVSLFRIGLSCSVESPKERMDMIYVTRELNRIKKVFLSGDDIEE